MGGVAACLARAASRARAMRSQASFTQEIFFQTTELLVEQVTRHLNQTYNYIDVNGRVAVFDTPGVRLSCPRRRA